MAEIYNTVKWKKKQFPVILMNKEDSHMNLYTYNTAVY